MELDKKISTAKEMKTLESEFTAAENFSDKLDIVNKFEVLAGEEEEETRCNRTRQVQT